MSHEPASFLIKKAHIELKVSLRQNRSVNIVPHECKTENLRLWQSIAQVQNVMAQFYIEGHKDSSVYTLLLSVFNHHGWTIKTINADH